MEELKFYCELYSHKIFNQLANMQGALYLINQQLNNKEKTKKLLDLISFNLMDCIETSHRFRALYNQQDFVKELKTINLCPLLGEVIVKIKNILYNKLIKISLVRNEEKFQIIGNDLIKYVFEIILMNSIKHNIEKEIEIVIKISKMGKEKRVKIEIEDNGVGLIQREGFKEKERIEEPKRKVPEGMGIGLLLVESILRDLNGEIRFENRTKGTELIGTKVMIHLPAI